MPRYDYRCLDCQHQYEKREGFEAPALQKCPTCGGTARRVIHAPPILFKGSGFYITDSRPATPEAETAASSEPASPAKGDGEKRAKTEAPAKRDGEKAAKTETPASTTADTPAAG